MTEPKRWKVKAACTECARARLTEDPFTLVVAAADFDRLRDERDRAVESVEATRSHLTHLEADRNEARRVAGVLADALRAVYTVSWARDHEADPGRMIREALAVFDTLTEEKT